MPDYRIDHQGADGSWSAQEFHSVHDEDAIAYALRVRTAHTCELYQAARWLATFDGMTGLHPARSAPADVEGETEGAYFYRRASDEREQGLAAVNASAKVAHLDMANYFESLARVVEAKRRRLAFYDVNAGRGE